MSIEGAATLCEVLRSAHDDTLVLCRDLFEQIRAILACALYRLFFTPLGDLGVIS
jgi:hypothetical protein